MTGKENNSGALPRSLFFKEGHFMHGTNKGFCSIALLMLMFCFSAKAQNPASINFECKKYSFIHSERNEIIGAKNLDALFEKLYRLKANKQGRVNVLQIGDSHIQADMLSAQVRNDMLNDFGSGGRGIVVPLRVAGTNEPFNYKITSNVVCTSKRCVFVNNPMPIGIGGVTIQSFSDSVYFRIRAFDSPQNSYAFNKVTLFYQKDSSFDFYIVDTLGNKLGFINHKDTSDFSYTSSIQLPRLTGDIILKAVRTDTTQTNAMIYGLNLENSGPGVVFSAIGVNGAEAFEYAEAKYFSQQTAAIHPDLLVISLGTNEAQHRPFDKEATLARFDSLVKQLRAANPGTPIILTTPPDSYYHKKYYNQSVGFVHTILVNYAKENNLAVWDLYSIAGGYKSCYQWKKYGLMRSDGVHFTKQGYEFQGNLFYEAFIKAYNKYVSSH